MKNKKKAGQSTQNARQDFKNIAIIGMGLMGGSLGHSLIAGKLCGQVTGIGRNISRLKRALAKKTCHKTAVSYQEGVKDADLVVIALPVFLIPAAFAAIRPYLKKNAVVTDMGSVKGMICSKIAQIDSEGRFTGSHPMAGSEKSGIENVIPGLYKGATCIVTPGRSRKAAVKIARFWKSLGMKTVMMTAAEHDKKTALISHAPHLMAFASVLASRGVIEKSPFVIGPGFKDHTRIAASDARIWAEIFAANKREILIALDSAVKHAQHIASKVEMNDMKALCEIIGSAAELRRKVK